MIKRKKHLSSLSLPSGNRVIGEYNLLPRVFSANAAARRIDESVGCGQ
jgi:hypothetical protein